MKCRILFITFYLIGFKNLAQFAPPAGQKGTTAIYKDSSVFKGWAAQCSVTRGYQDISNPKLGYASVGDSSMALGIAGSNGVVSLGDGGSATLSFNTPIQNGAGWDFAVFENGFDTFLELAFVEVSSDGKNFYRFPATSNIQDTLQTGGFGSTDATKINNLAGKYTVSFGTPFDLQELADQPGLNVNNVTHVKIIDVIGCVQNAYARYDQYGKKINDPWSTPFPSSGFDLDAVGVINQVITGVEEAFLTEVKLSVIPNPVQDYAVIQYYLKTNSEASINITDLKGKNVYSIGKSNQQGIQSITITDLKLNSGIYFLKVTSNSGIEIKKIIISNE